MERINALISRVKNPVRSVSFERSANQPTESQIRERAYEIYQSHRGATRNPALDWIEAEQQLLRMSINFFWVERERQRRRSKYGRAGRIDNGLSHTSVQSPRVTNDGPPARTRVTMNDA